MKKSDGECSSVGRAPGCGSGGRGSDPHHSPQNLKYSGCGATVAHSLWERGAASSSLAIPTNLKNPHPKCGFFIIYLNYDLHPK